MPPELHPAQPPAVSQASRSFEAALNARRYNERPSSVNGSALSDPTKKPFQVLSVPVEIATTEEKPGLESEEFLAQFRLPESTPIRFEADVVPITSLSSTEHANKKSTGGAWPSKETVI